MPGRQINQKIAVSVVFVAAMFMNIMDTTIVNVALPTIGRQFHVAADSVDTVAIGYLVSLAVFIPVSGWLGDRFGGRRVLLWSIVVFTVASALCGLADNPAELVGFRVLQGVGGGMMVPVGMALLYRTFPPQERVRASSILVIPTALAPALGPVLGGLFVTDVSWRWVFYVNLPIGAAALVFGLLFLAPHRAESVGRLDVVGFLLSGAGLGLVMYGVSEGPFKGWGQPLIVSTIAAGVVLLVAMVVFELRSPAPLIDLRLFRDSLFRNANIVMVLGGLSFLGVLFIVALFFQDGLGQTALGSGLSTFPEALGVMLGAQLVTRVLYPTFGPRRVMSTGLAIVAGSLALMSLIDTPGELWWMRFLMFVLGYGMGHVFTSAQAAGFATISGPDTARASTVFNALRQLGGAVGVAILSTIVAEIGPVTRAHGRLVPHLTAYHVAFLVAAGIAAVAALAAQKVDDAAAAHTMVPRRGRRAPAQDPQSPAANPVAVGGT
ncbi:MAG TPA: MDR family MFS transporter [Acidimicrobiales bacterium]|nr:MDR family MFS transporter [Acidimicrobiales bacterium]